MAEWMNEWMQRKAKTPVSFEFLQRMWRQHTHTNDYDSDSGPITHDFTDANLYVIHIPMCVSDGMRGKNIPHALILIKQHDTHTKKKKNQTNKETEHIL